LVPNPEGGRAQAALSDPSKEEDVESQQTDIGVQYVIESLGYDSKRDFRFVIHKQSRVA
jgi:hypothetical protein